MGLNGIGISSWQDDLVVSAMGTCGFMIVKAAGGAGYYNECFRRHADETLAAGKLLGCYHYVRDRGYEGSTEAEVDMGFSALAIADRMGHEAADITYRYAHLFPSVQADMARALDGARREN